MDKKTLIIDLDPQSSLSVYVGLNPLDKYASIENVFKGNMEIENVLKKALSKIKKDYDFILTPSLDDLFWEDEEENEDI